MRRYLKANVGRTLVIQCWGLAFRGELVSVKADGIELVSAALLDEGSAARRDWQQMDGRVFVPAGSIRFVQVA